MDNLLDYHGNRMGFAFYILLLLAACAAANSPGRQFLALQSQAKSICQIMASPDLYLGKRVMVRGIHAQDPHRRYLFDKGCTEWKFIVQTSVPNRDNPRARRILREAARRDPMARVSAVYSGNFTSRPLIATCTQADCYHYLLLDAQLLAASPEQ